MSVPDAHEPWTWRSPNGEREGAGLRYEPGSWGDVLKGTWALAIARALAERSERFRYLDPFAGAHSYPLTDAARRRLEWLGAGRFVSAQKPWLARGRLASTASLVIAEAAGSIDAAVFDLDDARRATWTAGAARVLESADGAELLATQDADWILIDPHDLAGRWPELLPAIARRARDSWILLYLYNRSPRGGGHERAYRAFRAELDRALEGELTIGRIPSDPRLPRAYHEVILSTPTAPPERLRAELIREAKALTCRLSTSGATEIVPRSRKVPR